MRVGCYRRALVIVGIADITYGRTDQPPESSSSSSSSALSSSSSSPSSSSFILVIVMRYNCLNQVAQVWRLNPNKVTSDFDSKCLMKWNRLAICYFFLPLQESNSVQCIYIPLAQGLCNTSQWCVYIFAMCQVKSVLGEEGRGQLFSLLCRRGGSTDLLHCNRRGRCRLPSVAFFYRVPL